tara:strand:+ start:3614 stop:4384 length:771 start_codon:yes stop_codon:yes gene_type:complete
VHAITDNFIWGIGTVATLVLVALKLIGFVEWPWWTAGIPYYVLFIWMLAYLSLLQLHPVGALGVIWLGGLVPLKLAGLVDIAWWILIVQFLGFGLLAGVLSRKSSNIHSSDELEATDPEVDELNTVRFPSIRTILLWAVAFALITTIGRLTTQLIPDVPSQSKTSVEINQDQSLPSAPMDLGEEYKIEDMKSIQENLLALGYYDGNVDGQLDPKTMTALIAYGDDIGMDMTNETVEVTKILLDLTVRELRKTGKLN